MNLFWPIEPLYTQAIRIFLAPIDRAFLTVDAQAQPVQLTRSYLRSHQDSRRTIGQTQQRCTVVIEPAPRHHGQQRWTERSNLESGYIFEQVKGVNADVADT